MNLLEFTFEGKSYYWDTGVVVETREVEGFPCVVFVNKTNNTEQTLKCGSVDDQKQVKQQLDCEIDKVKKELDKHKISIIKLQMKR